MTTVPALDRVYVWLYGILSADSTLQTLLGGSGRIHQWQPYQGAAYPRVTIASLTEVPTKVVGGVTSFYVYDWQTMVSGKTRSIMDLAPIANRVHALLDRASGVVTGGEVFGCYYASGHEYADPAPVGEDSGVRNIIQRWRIEARGA